MFDRGIQENEDEYLVYEPEPKKRKLTKLHKSDLIHSSLSYNSFKAPPLIEYKSIGGYCESKPGKSLLVSSDNAVNSPSTSGLNNVQSISSPIVFKSPKIPAEKKRPHVSGAKPFVFFSVEELSLVKCLKHWANNKVCAVGLVIYDREDQQSYLQSVMEKGHWKISLDTSLLLEIPNLEKLLQIFGVLEIINGSSRVKVNFYRNLVSVNLPLFVESYKLMQKYIPEFVGHTENTEVTEPNDTELMETTCDVKLNDTLDDYNFSNIM
uniref:Uncharacterized protein n=1 Tax=Graphocephala atropunctata TaxID=36148 RepID=A0A1B6KAW6_9HEMI